MAKRKVYIDPQRPRPGKRYQVGRKKWYLHCGIYSRKTNEWGYVAEDELGVFDFFNEAGLAQMKEI